MAGSVLKKIGQVIKKLKPKGKGYSNKSKNVGVKEAIDKKLYKVKGTDEFGEIRIHKGVRLPLDKKKYTERRPWLGENSGHYGPKPSKSVKKAGGGIATRGLGRAFMRGGKV